MDFRFGLVCMGREIFEKAMANPDSLAEADIDRKTCASHQYSIAIGDVWEERHDELEPFLAVRPEKAQRPTELVGKEFRLWEMSERYPRLAAKCGHDDSRHLDAKAAYERGPKKFTYVLHTLEGERRFWGFFAELMLDTGIIPSFGVIPPLPVVAAEIRKGYFIHGPELWFTWDPWELEQVEYYGALVRLERLKSGDFKPMRLNIHRDKLLEDYATPPSDDYSEWLQSLKTRGLVS